MATRQYYSAKATAEASTTATAPQDFVTLSFTPDDNADYLLVWSAMVRSPSALNTDTRSDVVDNASATLWAQNIAAKDTTDYRPVFGQARATFATATGSHTFRMRYSQETATGNVSRIRAGNLVAVKLATCDFFQGTTSESVTTATVETIYTTATTLSFTPSATGDYLIIGTGVPVFGSTNRPFWYRLTGGGTATDYGRTGLSSPDLNGESWGTAVRLGLTASQWDFSLQHTCSTIGNQGRLRDPRLSAIRLDQFATDYYAEARTRSTVTATSFATQVSLTRTPAARDHLVIGGGLFGAQTAANDVTGKFTQGGAALIEFNDEMNETLIDQDAAPLLAVEVRALAASSTTWTIEYTNETASIAANGSEAFISIINLDTTGGGTTTPLAFAVSAAGLTKLIKEPRLNLSARASGAVLIARLILLNRIAAARGTAGFSLLRVTVINLAATAVGVAAVTKKALLNLAATARSVPAALRLISLNQVARARGSPAVTRAASLALGATAVGVATAALLSVNSIVAAAVGVAVAAMSMIVYKVMSATATGAPTVSLSTTIAAIAANLTKLTGHAGLGIYLKAKTGWKKRRPNWKPRHRVP